MKFLVPCGGFVNRSFGILTSPAHSSAVAGIKQGMPWAADNECFTKEFNVTRFLDWLERMEPYRDTCLFVAVPDVVGDARATLERWMEMAWQVDAWPVAFVAQDGQEDMPFPESFDVLFIGGTTKWKMGSGALECIRRGQALGTRIHIGRVNWYKRYRYFAGLPGGEDFTCDGTRQRFEGIDKATEAWATYMERPRQLHLPVPGGNHRR